MRTARLSVVPAILLCSLAAGACGKKLGPSDIPTLTTDTFSGVLQPLGSSSHDFTVSYAVNFTDASITLTNLTTVEAGATPLYTVGVAFGSPTTDGGCQRSQGYSSPRTNINVPVSTAPDAPFVNGRYCVQIFDNPDAPTVAQPLNYTLAVTHY